MYPFPLSPYILDKWFESEPLKAMLATDSVIGAMLSPKMAGSGLVYFATGGFKTYLSRARLIFHIIMV